MRYLLTYTDSLNHKWDQQWIVEIEDGIEKGFLPLGNGPDLPGKPDDWQHRKLRPSNEAVASYLGKPNYTLEALRPPALTQPDDDDWQILEEP